MNSKEESTKNILDKDLKIWEIALNTQMHFNELLIRSRTTVVTVAMAVIGATLIAFRETNIKFNICNKEIHIGVIILFIGIVFLLVQFIIDYFYYFKMLLGAVNYTTALDRKYENKGLFGLTTYINRSISQRWAKIILFLYYIIPIALGILLIILIIFCLADSTHKCN